MQGENSVENTGFYLLVRPNSGETERMSIVYTVYCVVFVRCPDNSKIGQKMIYQSSKEHIKKSFPGLSVEFQACNKEEFDYNEFADEVEHRQK